MKAEHFLQATSLEEAYLKLNESNQNYILGGGAWMKLSLKKCDTLIALDSLELNKIIDYPDFVEVGSMTLLHDLEKNPNIQELGKGYLAQAISEIMGITIRNIATIGGSIVSKFGFSDLIPMLLALDTTLVFYKHGEISLKAFLESKTITKDILLHVRIKKVQGDFYFKKVKTTALDFAILNITVKKSSSGYEIILGSRPGGSEYAYDAMNLLNQANKVDEALIEEAAKEASLKCQFSSNQRASEDYRRTLAYVYTKRGLKEVSHLES